MLSRIPVGWIWIALALASWAALGAVAWLFYAHPIASLVTALCLMLVREAVIDWEAV